MKSFLDTLHPQTKTYLLYGQLNDICIGPDLIIRPMEAALVRMLKDRGYKHIIFFGTEGNRGGYCLDPESARFFFTRSRGIPLPEAIDMDTRRESAPAQGSAPAPAASQPQGRGRVQSRLRRRSSGHVPGSDPSQAAPAQEQIDPQPTSSAPAQEEPARVTYAMRNWQMSEFLAQLQPLMLNPDSHMAVVFYNIVNSHLYESQALLDSIRHSWEQSTADNICLLLAQTGDGNTREVLNILNRCALTDKFTLGEGAQAELNPATTHCFLRPDVDEVCSLLNRLRVVGTPSGRRITLDSGNVRKLADTILYCSQSASLRNIYHVLCTYVDAQPGSDRVQISISVVEGIWNMRRGNDMTALEQLNRPGWEAAYRLMCEVKRRVERYQRDHEDPAQQDDGRWCVGRLALQEEQRPQDLPKIPNFMLLGNPGTGKTTIARLMGGVLHELGLLRRGHVHEVTRAQLSDQYINGPARRTREAIRQAEGGVLFIDEAHRIASSDGSNNGDDIGRSIVSELNNATGAQQNFSLVLAGYEREMQAVLKLDPGFSRRFEENTIVIEDYKPELLQSILRSRIAENDCTLDPALLRPIPGAPRGVTPLGCAVERLYNERDRHRFGNAAVMQTLADNVCGRTDPEERIVRQEHFFSSGLTADFFQPHNIDNSLSSILADFDRRFVGMKNIRRMLQDRALEIREAQERGLSAESLPMRAMILVGNPGTGKTSVAEMLSRMYFGLGLLGTPDPLIVSASSLASRYQNGAVEAIQEHISDAQARKALLFIDEAHQLAQQGMSEAFRALMQPLTDREHPFLLVLASYPHELQNLLNVDAGAASRFEILRLEDYTGEELHAILHKMMASDNSTAPEDVDEELRRVCDYTAQTANQDSGNGRAMENLLREMNALRRRRCEQNQISFRDPDSLRFTREDIPQRLLEKLPARDEDCYTVSTRLLEEIERDYVGLQPVCDYIVNLTARVAEAQARGEEPYLMQLPALVVTGNPGSGKSLAIDLLTKALFRLHLISEPEPISINASAMLSSHANGNRQLADQFIRQAREKNSLLVVDKAHILTEDQSRGDEALQQFIGPLSDPERSVRVIFEVYSEAQEAFLRLDEGLRPLTHVIHLEDHTGEELFQILRKMAARSRWVISEGMYPALRGYCTSLYQSRSTDSGNARQMKNLLEQLATCHRRRCQREGIKPTDGERYWQLTEADLPEQVARKASGSDRDEEIRRLRGILERMEQERSGCEDMKAIVQDRVKRLIYNLRFPSRRRPVEPGHFFFVGSAGTGKTTSAEFLARYFGEIGLINSGELYKTTASDLIAGYVGQTQSKTREKLMAGRGRVMLIDEAYSLAGSDNGSADSFKHDALTELVSFLDDERLRKVTCVVFAGYHQDMEKLYRMNQGLASRVTEVEFPDFDLEQCMKVFCSIAQRNLYTVDEDAQEILRNVFSQLMRMRGFSNGRTVRRLCDLICQEAENRSMNSDYTEDDDRVSRLMAVDIPDTHRILTYLNMG